jgi:hypothetical protein
MKRRIAWILILIVDVADIAWGTMAAAMPEGLGFPACGGAIPLQRR